MSPRILVADDDPDLRGLVATRLALAGHEVSEAGDGTEAVAAALADPPDLLILDWQMPGLDGTEVCRRLRAEAATADLPIVLLTGHSTEASEAEAVAAGATAFVGKPFRMPALRAVVEGLLDGEG